jgi:hypothetical protein
MTPRNHPITKTLAFSLALGAIAPAAAQARLAFDAGAPAPKPAQDLRALAKTSSLAGTPAPPRQVVTAPAPRGFDWGDAAIGAAGGLGLSMVAVGGSLAVAGKRRHATAHEQTS